MLDPVIFELTVMPLPLLCQEKRKSSAALVVRVSRVAVVPIKRDPELPENTPLAKVRVPGLAGSKVTSMLFALIELTVWPPAATNPAVILRLALEAALAKVPP